MLKYGRASEEGRFSAAEAIRATKTSQAQERKDKTYNEIKAELARRKRRNQQEKIIEEL